MRRLRVMRRGVGAVVVGIAGGLFLVAGLVAVIVFVPQLAIDAHGISRLDWLKAVQDLRTSILQALGGLAVLGGAVVAALNLRETSRQNRAVQEQNRAVLELQRRGQTAERFTKAIEQLGQLGPEKLDVRIGAVYALEQIARDSPELQWPIMEVLTAYLREHAPVRRADAEAGAPRSKRLPADHQAIATVIGRRRPQQDAEGERLNLAGTDLPGVHWKEAHLRGAILAGAHLEGAELEGAHLEGAEFLVTASLAASLPRIYGAHQEATELHGAHLERADLNGAHLEGADLRGAHLEGAVLIRAHLERALLHGAHLDGAWLFGADLDQAQGMTVEQLSAAADAESADAAMEQARQEQWERERPKMLYKWRWSRPNPDRR